MTDWYVDHLSTLYPSAYMSTPSGAGSFPQEGDGTVYGGGTTPAVSVATMDFTTAVAAAGATFGVHGATLTCVASGAGTTQFNAGSGSTLAANLATAINAATSIPAVTTGGLTSPYLKGLVWASASGAVLTVYSRIASVSLNQAVNASCVLICGATGNWTLPPATTNFSGGVSGPWSHVFNSSALAVSISSTIGSAGTYGGIVTTMMGLPVAGDSIHIRTKRSGSNITQAWMASGVTVLTRSVGTFALPLQIIFDNGVKWSGDAGVFIMTLDASLTVNRGLNLPTPSGIRQIWSGTRLSATSCNWRLELQGVPVTANYAFTLGGNNGSASSSVDIIGLEICGTSAAAINNTNSSYEYLQIKSPIASMYPRETPSLTTKDVIFRSKGSASPFFVFSASTLFNIQAVHCLFDHTGLTATSAKAMLNAGTVGDGRLEAIGCQWVGFPAAANQSGFQAFSARRIAVRLRDCQYPNIKLSGGTANGGLVGVTEDVATPSADWLRSITVVSTIGNRFFVFENARRSFAWIDSAAPVTVNSFLPDGVTNFSIRTAVTTESGNVAPLTPVWFPALSKHNTLASGTRTAKILLLVDNNLKTALGSRDPNNRELWITVFYSDTSDVPVSVTSQALLTSAGSSLSAGTAGDWSATSYDVNGVTHNYTAYEIEVSCPSMKTLTEARLVVGQGFQGASVDDLIFLDPEWSLT